jgi:hypothetical protein
MSAIHMPEGERAGERESIWLDECVFRAGPKGIDDVAVALRKVQEDRDELAKWVEVQKAARRH